MCVCACAPTQLLSCVQLFSTPWTVAHQAPLSLGFYRREYWSGLPSSQPRVSLIQESHLSFLGLLHWQVDFLPLSSAIWRWQWHPTPVLLPGQSHGQRSLVGCSPRGHWESDTTEWLHCHFSLSCIGEGNGNPLQCSCLGNPRDRGAWWAAIYGVAQSQTRLKRLSRSSSSAT